MYSDVNRTKYPGCTILTNVDVQSPRVQNYVLDDPEQSFYDLKISGQRNQIFFKQFFTDPQGQDMGYYTTSIDNHFQGIVRHMDGRHLIISGSNLFDKRSALFVFKMKSYLTNAGDASYEKMFFRSNTIIPNGDEKQDTIESIFNFTGPYWHAGGISLLGDILVVPLENGDMPDFKSKIAFVNFRDPLKPKLYDYMLERTIKAGSTSMVKLNNGHYLLAVWTEVGPRGNKKGRFDFYFSKSTAFYHGFHESIEVKYENIPKDNPSPEPKMQAIQFFQKGSTNQLYIIGTDKGQVEMPDGSKKKPNRRFLFKVTLPASATKNNNPSLDSISVRLRDFETMPLGTNSYDFKAVGGFYVSQKQLYMYGGTYFRYKFNSNMRIAEFTAPINRSGICTDIKDAVLELYTEFNYMGRCLVLQIDRVRTISNFRDIDAIKKKHFNDCIQSIRYKFPKGTTYRLYEDKDFNENEQNEEKNWLDLEGNGKLIEIPRLDDTTLNGLKHDRKFHKEISSSHLII